MTENRTKEILGSDVWSGALPLHPGPKDTLPPGWNIWAGALRMSNEQKKHPSRLVDGHQLCGLAQDPLQVPTFRSYRAGMSLGRCKGTTFPRTKQIL